MQGDEYKSMKELGKEFGITSHKIGRTLKDIGLRTEEGKPSHTAFEQGYVKRRWAEQRSEIYLWVWHYDKTVAALESAGLKRVSRGNGTEPYSYRPVGTTGCEILNPDCEVIAWTANDATAAVIVGLLNNSRATQPA